MAVCHPSTQELPIRTSEIHAYSGSLRRAAVAALVVALSVITGAETAPTEQGGPQEGIKVVGEWTIVVRDASGKEVQRSEFRNALRDQGRTTLGSLLSRDRAISEWAILLSNGANARQPCGTDTATAGCGMAERLSSQLPFTDVGVVYTAGLTVGTEPADPSKVVLKGSTKATQQSLITTVSTMLSLCPAGPPSPTGCPTTQQFRYFSGTENFTNPPQVNPGQTIDVTVVFSFQ